MKKIENYLHLYLGCEVRSSDAIGTLLQVNNDGSVYVDFTKSHLKKHYLKGFLHESHKLILRPLTDMTEQEMIELIQLTIPENMEDKPTDDDYDLDLFYNDGGNMVDSDVAVGANYTCRCYEGQIAIRKCGSVHFFNEDGDLESVYNMPKVYAFLLSKQFDLGLIN